MQIEKAVYFAYRHTWRSGRSGFFKALLDGFKVYEAKYELRLVYGCIIFLLTFIAVCMISR